MKQAITALLIVLTLSACQPQQQTLIDSVPQTENELIYNDILSRDFVSTNVTILGVTVGMTEEDIRTRLGPADRTDEFDFGAKKNWHYSTSLGLNDTGVMYHFENGVATRIMVTEHMNRYLHGNSTIGKYKDEVYGVYGLPERQYDLPRSMRYFVYNKEGLEVYLSKGYEFQYAFVYPMRKLPPLVVENKTIKGADILNAPLPELLGDTTTLCDQGPTFGQNPSTKECREFNNSCLIPSHWVETAACP